MMAWHWALRLEIAAEFRRLSPPAWRMEPHTASGTKGDAYFPGGFIQPTGVLSPRAHNKGGRPRKPRKPGPKPKPLMQGCRPPMPHRIAEAIEARQLSRAGARR
jgi:hypothetical protein